MIAVTAYNIQENKFFLFSKFFYLVHEREYRGQMLILIKFGTLPNNYDGSLCKNSERLKLFN